MPVILTFLEHLGRIIEIAFNQPPNPLLVKLICFHIQERVQLTTYQLPVFVLIKLRPQAKDQVQDQAQPSL